MAERARQEADENSHQEFNSHASSHTDEKGGNEKKRYFVQCNIKKSFNFLSK
jgi:hypothetical protein